MQTSDITFVDTHCHLYASEFDEDRTAMIARAIAAGVQEMMLPNIDSGSVEGMWELVHSFPGRCHPMMGLHPCSVKPGFEESLRQMKEDLFTRDYVGIGETGVDLYWDKTYRDEQVEAFEIQIGWAKEQGLPVIIHSRDSLDVTIEIIQKHAGEDLRGIFHCFGGTYQQAMAIHEVGFSVGIGGVVTFKKSGLDEVLPRLPVEMIVLETDAPYLAPVPFRGKRNESSYIPLVAEKIALLTGKTQQEIALQTTRNAHGLFRKKI
jgi:TatD DNase family protein